MKKLVYLIDNMGMLPFSSVNGAIESLGLDMEVFFLIGQGKSTSLCMLESAYSEDGIKIDILRAYLAQLLKVQ